MSRLHQGELRALMEAFLKEHHFTVTIGFWDNSVHQGEYGPDAFILKAEREGCRLIVNHQDKLKVMIRKEKWIVRQRKVTRSGCEPRVEKAGGYDLIREQTFDLYNPRIMDEFMAMVEEDT